MKKEQVAAFEIWSGNSIKEGTLLSCWTVNGADWHSVADDSKWSVASQEEIEDGVEIEEDTEKNSTEQKNTQSTESESNQPTYTADELRKEIAEKESELKKLQIEKKKSELELEKLKKDQEASSVLATIDGIVKTAGDPENPPVDGSAFIEITGAEGMYIEGSISELMLDQIEVGQEISAKKAIPMYLIIRLWHISKMRKGLQMEIIWSFPSLQLPKRRIPMRYLSTRHMCGRRMAGIMF